MNVHPIFVHFPIALLTVYAILECIRFKRVMELHWWTHVKAAFAIIGAVSTAFALASGEAIEDQFASQHNLVEIHSGFAGATTVVFAMIAAIYLLAILSPHWRRLGLARKAVDRWWIMVPLALIGLVLITITGALGGALAYGPDIDPVVAFIYAIFVA